MTESHRPRDAAEDWKRFDPNDIPTKGVHLPPIFDETLEWLRNNELYPESVDDPDLRVLCTLAGVPLPRGGKLNPQAKSQALKDAVQWVRSNRVNPKDVDDTTLRSLANLTGLPLPRGNIPTSDKRNIVDAAMEWARNNEPRSEDFDEPTLRLLANLVESGKKIPLM